MRFGDILTRIFSWLVAMLFVSCFMFLMVLFWNRLVFPYDYRLFDTGGKENLVPGEPIGQKFVARENGLSQINILLDNLSKVFEGETIGVLILDENCDKVVRASGFPKLDAAPKQFYNFSFDPIDDSKGNTYCVAVLYAAPERRNDRPQVIKEKKTGNPDDYFTNLATGKVYEEETLIFRPAYQKESASGTLAELNRRLSAYKANYLKGGFLAFIFAGFLLSSLAITIFLILSRDED